ncbi:MAG: protein-L-isoaspartate O-methyltransferase [Candidatus Diapherotrites archaeon]
MDFSEKRKKLVASMQNSGVLKSSSVVNAFMNIPRENFFPKHQKDYAYADSAFSIGYGQTISQPSTIAVMLELLDVQKGMKVLEVGSGCGYVLVLLKELAGKEGKVFGIEIVPELVSLAKENLKNSGYEKICVTYGNGQEGFPEEKNFDRILISCACSEISANLKKSLAENGKLVAPVGSFHTQFMHIVEKKNSEFEERTAYELGAFVFVPLKE